ncbi:MAG: discoidin domain-containing protein [Micropepsaceae bacterium]
MRHFFAMGLAALAAGIALMAPAKAKADQVCHFLECVDGDTQAPPPVALPPKAPAPAIRNTARPQQPGEVCDSAGTLRYCVSSVLAPQYGFSYRPKNLFDGKYDTAWVPNTSRATDGIGESLVIDFGPGGTFRGLDLLNGYHKNESIFLKNNRVRQIEITLPTGKPQVFEIADGPDPMSFTLPQPVTVSWVRLRIITVHRGSKYHDTAISEIRVIP